MIDTIPSYILTSGVMAQQSRSRRPVSRVNILGGAARRLSLTSVSSAAHSSASSSQAASPPPSPTAAVEAEEEEDEDDAIPSEIKTVLGYMPAAQRGWPQDLQFDVPRLVNF
ncbi:hypothetical protein GQ54DRAFT_294738 [Martensiomyces pterosporus]|nr:hypothetical protein GQ54DRAFT_294738 [Martensiomyces pterosporus]